MQSIFSTKAEYIVHQGNCYKPNRLEKRLVKRFCDGKFDAPPKNPGTFSVKNNVVVLYSQWGNNEAGKSPFMLQKNPDDTRQNRKKWFVDTLTAFVRKYKPKSIAMNSFFSGENRKEYQEILTEISTEYNVEFFLYRF